MVEKDHRKQLLKIMKTNGLKHKQVAELLSRETGDFIAERTVFHWTSDPETAKTSHHVPGWILFILQTTLKRKAR